MADIDGMPPPTAEEIVSAYESLFVRGSAAQLHGFARSGQLRHAKLHSLCWKSFMGLLPEAPAQWEAVLVAKRSEFAALKDRFFSRESDGACDF